MTVGTLVDQLTVHEIQDWQAFYAEHPFPAEIIDIQGAQLAAILANVNRSSTTAAFRTTDFMVLFNRRQAPPPKPKAAPAPRVTEAQRLRAFFESGA